jgi:hypothetical protein
MFKEGQTLVVRLAQGSYRLKEPPQVSIQLPVLEGIEISGAARARIDGFDSDRPFHAKASGAGVLEGSIRSGDAGFDLSGASVVKLEGSSRKTQLLGSGASRFELANWRVQGDGLVIELSGASLARLSGSARAATIRAEGASHLTLANLDLEAADVTLSGASWASVRVKTLLNYEINSASHLEYYGEPKIGKAKRTGASHVAHR